LYCGLTVHNVKFSYYYLVHTKFNKKLSYRKQIARKLRTQYIKGIYSNSLTMKYKLEVTQYHWM